MVLADARNSIVRVRSHDLLNLQYVINTHQGALLPFQPLSWVLNVKVAHVVTRCSWLETIIIDRSVHG